MAGIATWKDLFREMAGLYQADFDALREQLRDIDGQKLQNYLLTRAAHHDGCAAVEPALNVSIEEEARLRARAVFAMNMARSLRRILELL